MEGIIIGLIMVACAMGYFIGSKRYIGMGWTIFFCLTGSLIFALPIIFSSTKKDLPPKKYNSGNNILGWILIIIGVVGLFTAIAGVNALSEVPTRFYERIGQTFSIAIFLTGLGIYLLQSNAFNQKYYLHNHPPVIVSPITTTLPTQPQGTDQKPSTNQVNPIEYNGGHNTTIKKSTQVIVQPNPVVPVSPPTDNNQNPNKSKEFEESKLYGKN